MQKVYKIQQTLQTIKSLSFLHSAGVRLVNLKNTNKMCRENPNKNTV